MSRVYREWRDHLKRCIDRYMGLKVQYAELHTSNLIGLFSCIFVRQDERGNVRNLSASEVKCGLKGHYGNKVGLRSLRLPYKYSRLCLGCSNYTFQSGRQLALLRELSLGSWADSNGAS